MDISNYQLPEIELPTEQILDDDHNEILAAFKVIENGYDRAQKRTRTILKAYNELQSVLINILKEHRGGMVTMSKHHSADPLIDENIRRTKTSTPKPQSCDVKSNNDSEKQNDIEMIDLTSVSNYNCTENGRRSSSPVISPELGCKNKRVKKSKSYKNGSFGENSKLLIDEEMEKLNSKILTKVSKRTIATEMHVICENEENRSPICENNANNADGNKTGSNDLLLNHHESRPLSKISLDKTIYNIEKHKTSSGKPLKQSTLSLQPISKNVNMGGLKKIIAKSDVFGKCGKSLFDKNYHSTEKILDEANTERSKEPCNAPIIKDSTEKTISVMPSVISKSNSDVKMAKTSLIIPTISQINETANSLFDDEDVNNFADFDVSLNKCSELPSLTDSPVVSKCHGNIVRKQNVGAVECTSATTKFDDPKSIDETFFAPAELLQNSDIKDNNTTDCPSASSAVLKSTDKCENVRTLKRKPIDELVIDTDKELGDLGLHDINWDAEISNDDWTSPKRPNDSFHMPPEKQNLNYAHKGKVERNKAKRSKLRGWSCWQCEEYYKNMDLGEDELRKRMDACSRHKSNYNPRYFTPEGFWDPEFPETIQTSICSENDSLQD